MANAVCRCGWDGRGEHPCHRCHEKPGKRRFYPPGPFSLSGQQMKLSVTETYGCDDCWAQFQKQLGPKISITQDAVPVSTTLHKRERKNWKDKLGFRKRSS